MNIPHIHCVGRVAPSVVGDNYCDTIDDTHLADNRLAYLIWTVTQQLKVWHLLCVGVQVTSCT